MRHLEARQMRNKLVHTLDARQKAQEEQVEQVGVETGMEKEQSSGKVILSKLPSILTSLDMDKSLSKKAYSEKLQKGRARLNRLSRRRRRKESARSSCSRAGMRRARGAPFAASPLPWTPATIK